MADSDGGRAGPRLWAARDLRRRWVSLLALGVLVALASGLAMATLAGARRTATAFPRLRDKTEAADAIVFPSQVGGFTPNWARLRDEPYVKKVAPWSLLFGDADGEPGAVIFGPIDNTWLNQVDHPIVVKGRLANPNAPDEVTMDEGGEEMGIHLGSTIRYRFYANGASDLGGKPPTGPTIGLHVVGVVRETTELLFTPGQVFTTPALLRDYPSITRIENANVQLRDPATDMAKLERDAPRVLLPGTPVLDLHEAQTRVSAAITVERSSLLLLAAAVAAASVVFIGLALGRSVAAIDGDAPVLRAMGFDRRDMTTAAVLPHLIVAGIGAAGGLAVALALSPRFPIGFASRVDPDKGFHADWVVLGPGVLITAAAVLGGAILIARRHDRRTAESRTRPALAARLANLRPLTVGLGVSMAFDPGRGRRSVPIRPALVAAVVAILGVTATMTIRHGLDQALADPARVGVTWDATVIPDSDDYDAKAADRLQAAYTRRVIGSPAVTDATTMWRSVINVGGVGVGTFALNNIRGDINLVTIAGRAPTQPYEADIGPATARQLHVNIGDHLRVGGHELTIVGRSFFPVDVHSGFDDGIWVTWPTLRAISPPTNLKDGSGPSPGYAVRFAAHTNQTTDLARLRARVPGSDDVEAASIPEELTNLGNVRTVPAILAAFLIFLGVSTLALGLIASVRARSHDFAVFRALGFTRRMSAEMVGAEGLTVALVGLVLGIPIGFVVGRATWDWVSSQVPMVFASPVAIELALVIIPVALGTTVAVSLWPAWRARRLRPAAILRTE